MVALVNGFVIAALAIELLFESWSAFVLFLIVLRIGNFRAGAIRSGKRRQNLPRHGSRVCSAPFVHGPLGTGHERSGRHRTMRLQELNAFLFFTYWIPRERVLHVAVQFTPVCCLCCWADFNHLPSRDGNSQ
jgi:hypothetical protein